MNHLHALRTPELDCLAVNMAAAVRDRTDTQTGGGIFNPDEVRKALAELDRLRELADLMAHIVKGEPAADEADHADLTTNAINKAAVLLKA